MIAWIGRFHSNANVVSDGCRRAVNSCIVDVKDCGSRRNLGRGNHAENSGQRTRQGNVGVQIAAAIDLGSRSTVGQNRQIGIIGGHTVDESKHRRRPTITVLAIEAGIEGIPAIGFSLLDYSLDANFDQLEEDIIKITKNVLENGLPTGVVLNVNFPKSEIPFKGIKVCRQAKGNWVEDFDKRVNPMGKEYYWLTGKFVNEDKGEDTDEWALANNYVSVVPTQFDLTAHHFIQHLNSWEL